MQFFSPERTVTVHEDKLNAPEKANSFPEIYANPPLENTELVYTVPVFKEWENGHLLRLLKAMFSQRVSSTSPFEVQLIVNIGENFRNLLKLDERNYPVPNADGDFILDFDSNTQEGSEKKQQALKYWNEAKEMSVFLRKIIKIQSLAQHHLKLHKRHFIERRLVQKKIDSLISSCSHFEQREILELAVRKAMSISLSVVDCTETIFDETPYHYPLLASLRTLGVDHLQARFGQVGMKPVIGIFDTDTILESNLSAKAIEEIFRNRPRLMYALSGMTYLPSGHSQKFFGGYPNEALSRAAAYNVSLSVGSPQIYFRFEAYEQLSEIEGYEAPGFHGYADLDTSRRLIGFYGSLEHQLLFQESVVLHAIPTALTSDRLGGHVDSQGRKQQFEAENGQLDLSLDVTALMKSEKEIETLIASSPVDQQTRIREFLRKQRSIYEKKQRQLQRLNKRVLVSFIQAFEQNQIRIVGESVEYDAKVIAQLPAGSVLLHYLNVNKQFAAEVLRSTTDVAVLKYFLGLSETFPQEVTKLTRFQAAIREYVCDPISLEILQPALSTDQTSLHLEVQHLADKQLPQWAVANFRQNADRGSILHSLLAETLALNVTYEAFFQVQQLREGESRSHWPVPLDNSVVNLSFGKMEERVAAIRDTFSSEAGARATN